MLVMKQKKVWIALLFLAFGILTIISGGKTLFAESGADSKSTIVPVVLWFNFVAGFFYVLAGVLAFKAKICIKRLSMALALFNVFIFIYLLAHIYKGGLYENKTLFAMSFRTVFWIGFALYFQKSSFLKKVGCSC